MYPRPAASVYMYSASVKQRRASASSYCVNAHLTIHMYLFRDFLQLPPAQTCGYFWLLGVAVSSQAFRMAKHVGCYIIQAKKYRVVHFVVLATYLLTSGVDLVIATTQGQLSQSADST